MNSILKLTLVKRLQRLWKPGDTTVGFFKDLRGDKKIRHFFENYDLIDLIEICMLVNAVNHGLDLNKEYDLMKKNLFTFSLIRVEELGPEVECGACDGSGEITCDSCYEGSVDCPHCDDGDIDCRRCDGTGEDSDGEDCTHCDGSGYEQCEYCDGDGRMDCDECGGTGNAGCDTCETSGYVTREDRMNISQLEYISYDVKLKNLLEIKNEFDVMNDEIMEYISNSKSTSILSDVGGINDESRIVLDGANFEENTTYFGELNLHHIYIRRFSKGVVIDGNLEQYYD